MPTEPTPPGKSKPNSGRRNPTADKGGWTPEMAMEMLVDFLRRRGVVAILLGLLVGGVCAYLPWMLMPLTYKAVAQVRIAAGQDPRPENFKATQLSIMTSQKVLDAALLLPKAKALPFAQQMDAVPVLRNWLKLETSPADEIVQMSLNGVDPEEITILVNAVLEAYINQARNSKNEQYRELEQSLNREIQNHTDQIGALRNRQKELAEKSGLADPGRVRTELDQFEHELAENRRQNDANRIQWEKLKKDKEQLETTPAQLDDAQILSIESDTELKELLKLGRTYLEAAQRLEAESQQGANDADVKKLKNQALSYGLQARERRNGIEGPKLAAAEERRKQRIQSISADIELLLNQNISLDSRKIALERKKQNLQKYINDFDDLKAQIDTEQKALDEAQKQLRQIQREGDFTRITKVEDAVQPKLPSSSPKRLAAIVVGGMGGFSLILLIFWCLDYRLKLISRPEHLQRSLSIPVIGILPAIPSGKRLPTDEDFTRSQRSRRTWQSMQESINTLRITLTFAADQHGEGLTCLMVTSPRDGEGKSTLTAQVGVSLARSGVRVVIVEADMHRPVQFSTFEVQRTPGLSDVLRGSAKLADVIQETAYPGLFLLPAGSPIEQSDLLLNKERLDGLFAELRQGFQTILIDAPPVLPVSDTLLLGQQADQTVLCALCNHSQEYTLQQAQVKLESVGINIVGVVVAGAPQSPKYQYYYYHSYA